jgi:hypothetical protein
MNGFLTNLRVVGRRIFTGTFSIPTVDTLTYAPTARSITATTTFPEGSENECHP